MNFFLVSIMTIGTLAANANPMQNKVYDLEYASGNALEKTSESTNSDNEEFTTLGELFKKGKKPRFYFNEVHQGTCYYNGLLSSGVRDAYPVSVLFEKIPSNNGPIQKAQLIAKFLPSRNVDIELFKSLPNPPVVNWKENTTSYSGKGTSFLDWGTFEVKQSGEFLVFQNEVFDKHIANFNLLKRLLNISESSVLKSLIEGNLINRYTAIVQGYVITIDKDGDIEEVSKNNKIIEPSTQDGGLIVIQRCYTFLPEYSNE